MKKQHSLWIMLGVILLLSVLVALTSLLGGGNETEGGDGETDAVTYLYLVDREPSDIRAIDYIYKGADPIRLVKSDKWKLVENDTFPVNQTKITTLANAMATVAVQREVTASSDNYAQYGLSEPETQITVTYADGSDITFYLGKTNAYLEGTCFLKTSESEAVYLVSETMMTFFSYAWYELLDLDTVPDLETSDLDAVVIENPRGTGISLSRIESEESDTLWKAIYGDGTEKQLDSSNLAGDLLAAVMALSLNHPVHCGEVTDDIRAGYGLDQATKVTLHYTETVTSSVDDSSSSTTKEVAKSYVLYFGADAQTEGEDRYVYMMVEDSSYIYRVLMKDSLALLTDFAAEKAE